jgi:hypothetical protein
VEIYGDLRWQRKSYCLLEIHDGEDVYAMNIGISSPILGDKGNEGNK